MVAGAELLLAPGQTDGQASPGGLLAGVRYLGHGGGHPAGDAHVGAFLENVEEVVQLLFVSVAVAGGERVEHGDLAGAGRGVEHWRGESSPQS